MFTEIRQLVAPMEEISAWHANAVGRLADAGGLYMSASDVDREQLSADHTLAAALLTRPPIPVPQRQTIEPLEVFARASHAAWAAARTYAEANSLGQRQRPAFGRMREMHRAAGRPAIGCNAHDIRHDDDHVCIVAAAPRLARTSVVLTLGGDVVLVPATSDSVADPTGRVSRLLRACDSPTRQPAARGGTSAGLRNKPVRAGRFSGIPSAHDEHARECGPSWKHAE